MTTNRHRHPVKPRINLGSSKNNEIARNSLASVFLQKRLKLARPRCSALLLEQGAMFVTIPNAHLGAPGGFQEELKWEFSHNHRGVVLNCNLWMRSPASRSSPGLSPQPQRSRFNCGILWKAAFKCLFFLNLCLSCTLKTPAQALNQGQPQAPP